MDKSALGARVPKGGAAMNTPVIHRVQLKEPSDGFSLCILTIKDAETGKTSKHEFLVDAVGAGFFVSAFTALTERLLENGKVLH